MIEQRPRTKHLTANIFVAQNNCREGFKFKGSQTMVAKQTKQNSCDNNTQATIEPTQNEM